MLALVFGLADGFVIPTSQGLIPLVVSAVRLQQANALLGLSRSILGVLGPALGGVLVARGQSWRRAARRRCELRRRRDPDAARADPEARRQRRAGAVPRRAARGLERVPAPDLDLDDDRLLRHRQLCVDVRVRARPARREGALLGRPHLGDRDQRVRCRHDPRRASSRCAYGRGGRCSSRASRRCRSHCSRSAGRSSCR